MMWERLSFTGVDPLAADYAGWSPYNYVLGNPVMLVDPDGKTGEPVFNSESGQIVIKMHYNFYGNSTALTSELANGAAQYLQDELNRNPSMANGPDGNNYPVSFEITASVLSVDEAKTMMRGNIGEGFDPKQNFVRVEDGQFSARNSTSKNLYFGSNGQEGRSRSVVGGDNSIYLTPQHLGSTTWIHEATAHGFSGRGLNGHIMAWSQNPSATIPSIRTIRFTQGVPSNLLNASGQLDITQRQVLPEDKPLNIKWNLNGKNMVGGATNTFFEANGEQKTFD